MELTQIYTVETDDASLRLIFLMNHGKVAYRNDLRLEIGAGEVTISWDNEWFIRKLYKELKTRKKSSKRLKSLRKDLVKCEVIMTRNEVRKFLKSALKIHKTLEKGYE